MLVDTKTLHAELSAVNGEATTLCAGLAADQLAWQPQPTIWSIAQNLVHLTTTTKIFLPAIDQAISKSRRRGLRSEGPFRLGPYGRLLVWYVEPPTLFRLPAPRLVRPRASELSGQVLESFLAWQGQMAQRISAASGLNLIAFRFSSPLARYIRMNLLEFFSVFNMH